jgi:sigma-B regulation protein RsbU (phosphoserine phosphatase)
MHANDVLVRRTVESRFATLLYGVLSCDGRLTYCNAGHNPPLIIGSRGVRRLEKGGLILGAFKDVCFEDETVQFDPGDVLVVFSDGVTEALNAEGADFGEGRVLSAIQPDRDSAQTILDDVLSAVRKFSAGAEQSDDVTALVLRYTGT